MIRIQLKEPVGGMINPDKVAARSSVYMQAQGEITEEFAKMFDACLKWNQCLLFKDLKGNPFAVPASNIAYVYQEDVKK